MKNLAFQLRTHRHLVVVSPSASTGERLSEVRRDRGESLTWTNRGTTALRLVPSHHDSVWLIGETLTDMPGQQLLELLHAIEPALDARVVLDWASVALLAATTTRPGSQTVPAPSC